MARIRTIKPEFFYSEQVTSVSMAARMFFVGLWTLADREGRLQWAPKKIRAQLFPYAGDPSHPHDHAIQVFALAEELTAANLLHIYEVDRETFAWIPGFTKHQRPHPKEPRSALPPCPPDHDAQSIPWNRSVAKSPIPETLPGKETASRELPGTIPSSPTGKGREGKEISEREPLPPRALSVRSPSLVQRRDLTAFMEGPIFNIPQKWADQKLKGAQGSLSARDLSDFGTDAMQRAERERVDFSSVHLLNWLDTALREWRERKTQQRRNATQDARGTAFLEEVARMEAGQ